MPVITSYSIHYTKLYEQERPQGFGPAVAWRGEALRGGDVDEEGAHEAGVGEAGDEHHERPGDEEFAAAQEVPPEDASAQAGEEGQPEEDDEGGEREVAAAQERGPEQKVVGRNNFV